MRMDLQLLNDVNIFEAGNWTPSAFPSNFDDATLFSLGSSSFGGSSGPHSCSFCDSFDVTTETIKEMERVMQFLKALHTRRQRRAYLSVPCDNMQFADNETKVQLVRGFQVYIKKADLEIIKLKWKANANGLIRQLMKAIIGPAKLKNMTPMGRGRNAIPQAVMKAVFKYVTVRRKLEITYSEYTRVLSQMCYRLRSGDQLKKHQSEDLSEPGNERVRPISIPHSSEERRKQSDKNLSLPICEEVEPEKREERDAQICRKESELEGDGDEKKRRSTRDKSVKDVSKTKEQMWKTELFWEDDDDDDDWMMSDHDDDEDDECWIKGNKRKYRNKSGRGGRGRKRLG